MEGDQEAIYIVLMIVGYFLPALISMMRGHHNKGPIILLNLLLGWTLLVWVICLVWAFTSPPKIVVNR